MGMSRDLSRQVEKRTRHWQRILKEKAYQRESMSDHSREFSDIVDAKKTRAKQRNKIDQMRRH